LRQYTFVAPARSMPPTVPVVGVRLISASTPVMASARLRAVEVLRLAELLLEAELQDLGLLLQQVGELQRSASEALPPGPLSSTLMPFWIRRSSSREKPSCAERQA
jgi:hypothetical protein